MARSEKVVGPCLKIPGSTLAVSGSCLLGMSFVHVVCFEVPSLDLRAKSLLLNEENFCLREDGLLRRMRRSLAAVRASPPRRRVALLAFLIGLGVVLLARHGWRQHAVLNDAKRGAVAPPLVGLSRVEVSISSRRLLSERATDGLPASGSRGLRVENTVFQAHCAG